MKKRWAAAILTVTLILGVCGCEKQPAETPEPTPTVTQTPTPTPSPTATPTPTLKPLGQDGALLMAFVRGESKGAVDKDFYDEMYDSGLADMEPFTIRELFQRLSELEERAGSLTYALMDTLGGREMLVLYYTPSAAMGPYLYLVFGVFDGQIRLTYATDFAYRSYAELRQGLAFYGGGSGGAGYHSHWDGYIDETGHYQALYQNGEILSGGWAFGYARIDDENLYDESFELRHLEMDATEYYELGQWTEEDGPLDPALLARTREYLDGKGMTEIDSVDDLIADAYVARGFPRKPEPYDGPWLPLELDQ